MAGPTAGQPRQPAVAGLFYPADPEECRALARSYTQSATTKSKTSTLEQDAASVAVSASGAEETTRHSSLRLLGGVVPHAGWVCSGAVAGETIAALAAGGGRPVDLVVVFGAIHTPIPASAAALDTYRAWCLPGDDGCPVDDELRRRILERGSSTRLFCVDDRFHLREHAVEVELPLIRSVWPDAGILPVEVPPDDRAAEVGRMTAQVVSEVCPSHRVVFLASSDLTHYGPNYDFVPAGVGLSGLHWAMDNDRRLIEKVLKREADAIVPEVKAHANACGAGAIAAMLAACNEMGATRATLLRHTNSFETLSLALGARQPQTPDNAVGYASIVVG